MENRTFIEFVDEIYRRDELPVWRNVAQLVAAMAAFHHLHGLKVSRVSRFYDADVYLVLAFRRLLGGKKKPKLCSQVQRFP